MTHYRSEIRGALRLTLKITPYFAVFTHKSAWSQSVDAASLPVIGVATPRESKDQDTLEGAERSVTAIVVLKRQGGDELEDTLDADSVEVELGVLTTVRTLGHGAMLESTDIDIAGSAEQRVGTLTMVFRAIVQTPEPLTP